MSHHASRMSNSPGSYEEFRITKIAPLDPVRRGPTRFGFSFKAAGRIAAVAAEMKCELGSVRRLIAPGAAGLEEKRGAGALALDLGRLPRGPARLSLALVDAEGRAGDSASVDFDVPCGEPTDPGTLRFSPLAVSLSRPRGADLVHARFRVSGGPAPGSMLFVSVALPDRSTETLDIAAPGHTTDMTLFSIGSSHLPGRYDLTARIVGPGGDVGDRAMASIELLEDGEVKGPSIASIATGKDGRIRVRGSGFSAKDITALVGHLPAAILAAGERELIIDPPNLDEPSPVFVATPWGEARSVEPWRPPVRVAVVPEEFTLSEGGTLSLTALVSGTSDKRVIWSVKGKHKRPPVRIDGTGRVTANFPGKAVEFSVTARSAADGSAVATAWGAIGPRPDGSRGPATVGALGGAVRSRDGGAVLRLPPGALSAPRRMSIETVMPPLGRTRSGPLVAGEVALKPAGLALGKAATIELNLPVALPPGSTVPVRVRRRGGKQWDVLDWNGVVGLNGNTLSVHVREVPNRLQAVIEVDWRHTFPRDNQSASPMIFSLTPNQVDEGATVAVLVTGVNFVPGRTAVEFRRLDGTVEQRVELRGLAITADGTRLGLSLKAGVMTDLAERQWISLTLRVITPAGTADGSIAILGHDELDVLTGSRTLAASGRFSRMDVEPGARLNIASTFPPVRIECFERAYLRSFFDAQGGVVVLAGDGGRPAPGSAGGAGGAGGAGTGPAGLGAGGTGGNGAAGMSGTGAAGAAGRGSATLTPAGAGGRGGRPGGFGIFPHAGGTGGDGSAGWRTAFPSPDEAFEPGTGGGGGGGGGGEGMIFQNTGGGGGGGGAGGGAVSIAAGEELTMQGDVVAAGGTAPSAPTRWMSSPRARPI